jgi:hypothetical protein
MDTVGVGMEVLVFVAVGCGVYVGDGVLVGDTAVSVTITSAMTTVAICVGLGVGCALAQAVRNIVTTKRNEIVLNILFLYPQHQQTPCAVGYVNEVVDNNNVFCVSWRGIVA